jgi:ribosome-associated toxin RatA of RatAB toxin-antitoxin module
MRLFTAVTRLALLRMRFAAVQLSLALLALLALIWPAICAAQAAETLPGVVIHVEQKGSAVAVAARALLVAPLPLIWETLTDYERFPLFIPGMSSSRVMERRGPLVMVKQAGEAGFLFFTLPIDVVLEVLEKPPHVMTVRALSGTLKTLDGRYHIEADYNAPGKFVLHWNGVIEPESSLPAFIGLPLLRRNVSEQFRGMVREIERRAALPRSGGSGIKTNT